MKEHNIRRIGKPLGRPVNETLPAEQQKVKLAETSERNQNVQLLDGLSSKGHQEAEVAERDTPLLMFMPTFRFGMEGTFGLGKRHYAESQYIAHKQESKLSALSANVFGCLFAHCAAANMPDRVKTRLRTPSSSWICASFFAMNLMTILRQSLFFVYFLFVCDCMSRLYRINLNFLK